MKFNWLINQLQENKDVLTTLNTEETLLTINRKNRAEPLTLSIISSIKPSLEEVNNIIEKYNPDFILHTQKEAIIDGEILILVENKKKILGHYGDVFRIVRQEYNFPYINPDVKFIVGGLKRHTKVHSFTRIDNKRYKISRYGLEDVIVITLYDYDLAVDALHSAMDNYEQFDAILKANPNGRISSDAIKLADSMKIKIFGWREFLGELNRRWK